MRFYADLHVRPPAPHGEELWRWVLCAAQTGISVLGTGRALTPEFLEVARRVLVPAEPGLYRLCDEQADRVAAALPWPEQSPRLLLSAEITSRHRNDGKLRTLSHLILFPELDSGPALLEIASESLTPRELYEKIYQRVPDCLVVPARIFEPERTLFGWKHGFDRLEDAELEPLVHALDRGRAAPPDACARLSSLDGRTSIVASEASRPEGVGEHALLFDCDFEFASLRRALTTGAGLCGSVGAFPDIHPAYFDGHRRCQVILSPWDSRRRHGMCPVCDKPLALGVRHRIETLADRRSKEVPPGGPSFQPIVPLRQLLGETLSTRASSVLVDQTYQRLIRAAGPELQVLLAAPLATIEESAGAEVAEAVRRLRCGDVTVNPGGGGQAGSVLLFHPDELRARRNPPLPHVAFDTRCAAPDLATEARPTVPITLTELASGAAEADYIASSIAELKSQGTELKEIGVVYRTTAQGLLVRKGLDRREIKYQCRSHLKLLDNLTALAILHEARTLPAELPLEHRLEVAGAAVAGRESTLEVRDALELLLPLCDAHTRRLSELFERAARIRELDLWDGQAERVSVMTMHAAREKEFAVLFLAGCDEGIIPYPGADVAAERELFHAALSRAHGSVRLCTARRRLWRGHIQDFRVSPFVGDIRAELLMPRPRPVPVREPGEQLELFA